MLWNAGSSLWRAGGFSCSLKAVHLSLRKKNIAIIDQNITPDWNRYYSTYPDPEPEQDVVTLEGAHCCVISTRPRGHHFFNNANDKFNVSEENQWVKFKHFAQLAVKKWRPPDNKTAARLVDVRPKNKKTIKQLKGPDLDPPDPHVFGPPKSGSINQKYGSGSFNHQAINRQK